MADRVPRATTSVKGSVIVERIIINRDRNYVASIVNVG